jgi:hypothetical protein
VVEATSRPLAAHEQSPSPVWQPVKAATNGSLLPFFKAVGRRCAAVQVCTADGGIALLAFLSFFLDIRIPICNVSVS